ncbi:MAG: NAD-dependent epimerase/dehydratase family protein [Xanthobacteraceae bacterium]|nr:NAD-dependent epimerase/dehydratase family protein [Xanthobacteraceae bacterium]
MRILVTGATGFIGRNLVPTLIAAGHEVVAAGRNWSGLVHGCEGVVHLAAIAHIGSSISSEDYDRVNHRAVADLALEAQRAGVDRFVFISSIRAQTGSHAYFPITEIDPPQPTDDYGKAKLAAERAIEATSLRFTILRPVTVYGPGVKGNFASLVRLARLPAPLPFGALNRRRSLLDCAALVDAVVFSLSSPCAVRQTFIVADRKPVSVCDIVVALRRGMNRPPAVFSMPRSMLKATLSTFGRGDDIERLDGELIASPAKLISAGWRGVKDTPPALESYSRQLWMRAE